MLGPASSKLQMPVSMCRCPVGGQSLFPTACCLVQVSMNEIDLNEQIGKGGFGAVYKGTWRGAPVAVKYAVCNTSDADSIEQSIREVVLSKKMSHPNVVSLSTMASCFLGRGGVCNAASCFRPEEGLKYCLVRTVVSSADI